MADLKDKEYSLLKENLENLGLGAEKHEADPVPGTDPPLPPLPKHLNKKRYDEAEKVLTVAWNKAKDAITAMNTAFDEYQKVLKSSDGLYSGDVRTYKGLYGIYSEVLRDYGIAPEKKRKGRPPKPPTP